MCFRTQVSYSARPVYTSVDLPAARKRSARSATPASSHVAAVSCGCCRPFGWEVAEAFNSCFTSTVRPLQQSDVCRTRNDMSDETSCAIAPTTFQLFTLTWRVSHIACPYKKALD